MKFCVECAHHDPDPEAPARCAAPVVSLVSGDTFSPYLDCSRMREHGQPCGPDGVLWEARA